MSKEAWGEGSVFLRGKTYWVQYCVNGRRVRESAKTEDQRKAKRFLREKLTAAQGGAPRPTKVTVDALLYDLERFYEDHRPKSVDWARIVIEHLRGDRQLLNMRAGSVGTAEIQNYVSQRRGKGIANGTINRELALLRRAFSLGLSHEPPLVNRVPKIPKLSEPEPRAGFFEVADFRRLCAELPQEVRDVAVFAFWTGCRKSEILGLRWPQVDLAARLVRLETTKNNEQRDIPLSKELWEMLSRRKSEAMGPWVFHRGGRQIVNFYTSWKSACKRAELSGDASLLHDLRRTGVRNLVRAGVPRKVAMLISGHKTESVFERYHIVDLEDVQDAMKRLEGHLGGADERT